jgi:hypothetical protein
MILAIDTTDVTAGASMSFYTRETLEVFRSIDANNDPAATCTLVTSATGSSLFVEPGEIFAQYDCPSTRAAAILATNCHVSGFFYFTDCSS